MMFNKKRDIPVLMRLAILLVVLAAPLGLGLLLTYDVIKIEWISSMEIQPSFNPQEDPLPLPARSVPLQGAAYIPELGAPANPTSADAASLERGKESYEVHCALCHGKDGKGTGVISVFLSQVPPANLIAADAAARTMSDGALFLVVSNGIGKMPPLKENLPEPAMRWDVVNYLRQLQATAQ